MTEDQILEAAQELAGIKAYQPDANWTFDTLKAEIAEVLRKHQKPFQP